MSTPLPDLERQLVDAARRLEAPARRRSRWPHGWALVAVILATTGVGAAAAKVVGVDPFAYLNRYAETMPQLAATSDITVVDDLQEPTWQARALVNKAGELCITGGPADPRTSPDRPPTDEDLNNPPSSGMTCSHSEEAAESLIDPTYPGATFAGFVGLAGSANTPTRLLVYAVTADGGPTPRVRFGVDGKLVDMREAKERLKLVVDKSAAGLDAAERRQVAEYPDALALHLWAAEVAVPSGAKLPQLLDADLAGDDAGPDDSILVMVPEAELMRRADAFQGSGRAYARHIERDPQPVPGVTDAQRAKIAAFARPRTSRDAVPASKVDRLARRDRAQPAASRRLSTSGADLGEAWILPGGMPRFVTGLNQSDTVCVLGPRLLAGCRFGVSDWKRPFVEATVCARGLAPDRTLVWALAPTGARRLELVEADGRRIRQPLAELVVIERPRAGGRLRTLVWTMADGKVSRVSVPWPTPRGRTKAEQAPPRCGNGQGRWTELRKDSEGATSQAGRFGNTTIVPPEMVG